MIFREFAEKNNLEIITNGDTSEKEIRGCYVGDLLSWVMSKCREGDIWITVMNNINIIAVASMSDAAAIILADGVEVSEEIINKANMQNVCIAKSSMSAYELCRIAGSAF